MEISKVRTLTPTGPSHYKVSKPEICITCSCCTADSDTDYSCCKTKPQLKRIHHSRQGGKAHIDTTKTRHPENAQILWTHCRKNSNILMMPEHTREHFSNPIYHTALLVFKKKQGKRPATDSSH